ncbi:winged helix-turn-helix domain-containing protein [Aurantimonas sp. HBX-1]|uniref:winged helix-turn-helix domain-containing protein n=1 Tax=Aurantimonas sp. HBX-1 TaxID=2906072 RepID=UPI001F1CCE8F|nr:crosslink repair DNA glycosylase YcaQ family protein [Aurantimonas sp. HBX-1]UIJ71740.1 winged helix DNA-binding domain-containing protein [Aurantimonas sp. HBX-1]
MPPAPPARPTLPLAAARRIWLGAQCLDRPAPFGAGAAATPAVVAQLGYVQIDTIHVVERSHHHILWTRIPAYERADLHRAQSVDRTVFEYWTHALSYVPAKDFRFFLPAMRRHRAAPAKWFGAVTAADMRKVLTLIRDNGPLTIRDIDDDVLVEKDHAWASRKPSKRALQMAFYNGDLVISARAGMLKTYELTDRHFGWEARPRPATPRQVLDYRIDRALRSQGVVSLDSICHLQPSLKPVIRPLLEARAKRRQLVELRVEGAGDTPHWAAPETLETIPDPKAALVHILSPFDPLVIQRKRLEQFFGYAHRFEAYVPKEKRLLGYFALPVLAGDRIVAALDLKTDRAAGKVLIQQWNWIGDASPVSDKPAIEDALQRFEEFQLAK